MRTRAIRIFVIAVCALGVAGIIVFSATNHNGAALTCGLITAVAVLCQMAMTTAINEVKGLPGAPVTPVGGARPEPAGIAPPSPPADANPVETDAAELESRIEALVAAGVEE